MITRRRCFLMPAFLTPLAGRAQSAAPATGDEARLRQAMPGLMRRHHVPGAAVVVLKDHRVAWTAFFGVREAGKPAPVDERTVFEAASMTKPLAAYVALKLAAEGLLDLDKPLAACLPQPWIKGEPLHEKITARMVLCHTGGFPNWRPAGGALKVMHEPGTRHLYSGEGFYFLQAVMEHITNQDYQTLLQNRLLGPLGMKSSSHVWQDAFVETAAAGHDDEGRVKTGRKLYRKPNAAYTLYCTPLDYSAFLLEMMKADRSAPHSLGAAGIQAMLTPAGPPTDGTPLARRGSPGAPPVRFGLGWSLEPVATGMRARHSGSNGTGFRSYCEFAPAGGHGLIIMTNSTSGDDLWREVVNLIGVP